jgi:hypothetical protein
MRYAGVLSVCLSVATTFLTRAAEFSQTRDLPPLKVTATELDTVLHKTRSLLEKANGPQAAEGSVRESVKLRVHGREIEIPHFSIASSLAFPKEIFGFSYTYYRADKPVSSLTIDLGDSSRRVLISGESADQVEIVCDQASNDLLRYSSAIGGAQFRRVVGAFLCLTLLTALMVSSAYCWNTRRYNALGMPICSAIGFLLLVLLPWNRLLPGFALYQRYSPFFLVRHASQISVVALMATLVGIPVSYFLARTRGNT